LWHSSKVLLPLPSVMLLLQLQRSPTCGEFSEDSTAAGNLLVPAPLQDPLLPDGLAVDPTVQVTEHCLHLGMHLLAGILS